MQDKKIIFSIFCVLSQKIWKIFTALEPKKFFILLRCTDKDEYQNMFKKQLIKHLYLRQDL